MILADTVGGFAHPITVRSPEGVSVELTGLSSDISEVIDPETGTAVSGRFVHVSVRIPDLTAAQLTLPVNIPDDDRFPWIVEFADVQGREHKFKVRQSKPDAIGMVNLVLEAYS